jgi:hypothetical protein
MTLKFVGKLRLQCHLNGDLAILMTLRIMRLEQ